MSLIFLLCLHSLLYLFSKDATDIFVEFFFPQLLDSLKVDIGVLYVVMPPIRVRRRDSVEATGSFEGTRSETQSEFEFRTLVYQDPSLITGRFEDDSKIRDSSEASDHNCHFLAHPTLKPFKRASSFSDRATKNMPSRISRHILRINYSV